MNISEITKNVLSIPRQFNSLSSVSVHTLLRESGYFEHYKNISEDVIHNALADHPELIQEWMQFSEDKRTCAGWYVTQDTKGQYGVGRISENAVDDTWKIEYARAIDACTAFIMREIEDIRQNSDEP